MNSVAPHLSIPIFLKKQVAIVFIGLAVGTFIHLIASGDNIISSIYPLYAQYIIAGLWGIICAAIIQYNNGWLNRFLPWAKGSGKRLLIGLIINMAIALLAFKVIESICLSALPQEEILSYKSKLILLSFIAILIYSIIYFALVSYNSYSQKQLDSIQIKREQIDLQYQALKSQLSPHFLFNGLNTMSALVYENSIKTKKFIRHFADCYKFVLKNYNSNLISVAEEMDFVEAYVFLLRTRHQNNIQLKTEITTETLKSWVPPLAIQMLVENAAKHNQISDKHILTITITEKNNQLIVKNNKTKAPIKIASFKIGLNNILKRYRLMGHANFQVVNETSFIVKLPCIRNR